MSPDEVCGSYADQNVKITCRRIDGGLVLLEGSQEALEFLSRLILAQADFAMDCGFQLAPDGPGGALFNKQSDLGIYIHRLPCVEHITEIKQ
jgi:hypothetical protein